LERRLKFRPAGEPETQLDASAREVQQVPLFAQGRKVCLKSALGFDHQLQPPRDAWLATFDMLSRSFPNAHNPIRLATFGKKVLPLKPQWDLHSASVTKRGVG